MKLKNRMRQGAGDLRHTLSELWYLLRQSWVPVTLFSLGARPSSCGELSF